MTWKEDGPRAEGRRDELIDAEPKPPGCRDDLVETRVDAGNIAPGRTDRLCGALERDDRQVLATSVVPDRELDVHAGHPANERVRPRACRSSRPVRARLEAGTRIGRTATEIDLIGSSGSPRPRPRPYRLT